MNKVIQIAIDGPAGAGKSTVAKKLAEKLNILYLDTGAMYRAVAYYAMQNQIKGNDDHAVRTIFDHLSIDFVNGKLILNGSDVSSEIRTPDVEREVSEFASNPLVREKLVEMQRKICFGRSVVMEGRDIGTVVLKDTPYKFYLDANVDVRAKRRFTQNEKAGDLETIKQNIVRRDCIDANREKDPLTTAPGSVKIDTSNLSLEEVIALILNKIKDEDCDVL